MGGLFSLSLSPLPADESATLHAKLDIALSDVFKYKQIAQFNARGIDVATYTKLDSHPKRGARVYIEIDESGPFDFAMDGALLSGIISDGKFYFVMNPTGAKHTLTWQGQSVAVSVPLSPAITHTAFSSDTRQLVINGSDFGALAVDLRIDLVDEGVIAV